MLMGVYEDPEVNWIQYLQFKGGNVAKA
jgi:hypothetical protein